VQSVRVRTVDVNSWSLYMVCISTVSLYWQMWRRYENMKVYAINYVYMYIVCLSHKLLTHLAVCLATGPKQALYIVRSRASSFRCVCPLLSSRSSSSFLCLLPRLPVTSILPLIFPSITYCRRQFLLNMWQIQLAFRLLISCSIFICSLALSNTCSFLTWSA
jgi:hypothetical protein